jgi:hypothetical protein
VTGPLTLKVAVTVLAALMVTVHVVPETVLQPLQLAKVDPLAALAVSVTLVPLLYSSEQSVPQLIPAGFELTLPLLLPAPVLLTVRTNCVGCVVSKVAVTVLAAFMVTEHVVPETESQPLQPAKADPAAALAVTVTLVPLL